MNPETDHIELMETVWLTSGNALHLRIRRDDGTVVTVLLSNADVHRILRYVGV